MKGKHYRPGPLWCAKAAVRLAIAGLVLTSLSCCLLFRPSGEPAFPPSEQGGILKMLTVPLKDGGHADIRFEKLIKTVWTRGGWFQGAGGQQSREIRHFYLIVRGTAKLPSGLTKEFTWIGPYEKHWSVPYLIPQRLVISGNDVFIEYGAVPMEYQAKCTDVVKRKRYKGTRKCDFDDLKNPLVKYGYTYKWPVEYVWEDVTKGTFEQAARTGVVVSLDSNWDAANNVCEAGDQECYTRCSEQMDGPGVIDRRFYFQVAPLNVENAEQTLNDHPEVIHTDLGRKALHRVIDWFDPKRKIRKDNDAKRMLALLFKFNSDINAVDSMNRTPLHVAVELNVERNIVDELIRRGGRILYPPCGFREAVLAKYPELAKNDIIREVGEAEGWIDDDAYQVWVEGTRRSVEGLQAADDKFSREFGMKRLWSEAAMKISALIASPPNACNRKDPVTGQEQWLARVAYPGLRDLLNQYHRIMSIPYP